ncbi:MAG: type II 3-dehydroquinate dehydratase [Rhodobiaceae bacterium]|nr:type II 3-dehydroquinate dehydratase [Rhodobiaceae bacterium]|tara:strand:- start:1776 stop:2213 length:438 start_codon:yes stop_codon:yes gene_type:complete
MSKVLHIINGPNLNLLGTREPEVYGTTTLADIEAMCANRAQKHGMETLCLQSNDEGEMVNFIQTARTEASGLIINAGAYSHTSVAILDALQAVEVPVIEVHLSNIFAREEFRHHSYVSGVAAGVICGLGAQGYEMAIDALAARLA